MRIKDCGSNLFIFAKTTTLMDLNFFLSPWTIFFVALIVIIVMLIFLTLLERKLKKRITIRKEEQSIFQKKLDSLKSLKNDSHQFLVAIDELARDFFSRYYKADRDLKYSELVKVFRKQGNIGAVQFCERIQESFYSGDTPSKEKLEFLVNNLEFLITEHNKLAKQEKSAGTIQESASVELDKRVTEYLNKGLRRGFKLELLRQKLLEAGFKKSEIEFAEEHLNLHIKNEPEEIKEVAPKKIESPEKISPPQEKIAAHKKDSSFVKSLDNLERIKGKISEKTESSGAKKISDRTGLT